MINELYINIISNSYLIAGIPFIVFISLFFGLFITGFTKNNEYLNLISNCGCITGAVALFYNNNKVLNHTNLYLEIIVYFIIIYSIYLAIKSSKFTKTKNDNYFNIIRHGTTRLRVSYKTPNIFTMWSNKIIKLSNSLFKETIINVAKHKYLKYISIFILLVISVLLLNKIMEDLGYQNTIFNPINK